MMGMQGGRPTHRLVSIVAAALLAGGALSACDGVFDDGGDDYEAVCVQRGSDIRVDDSKCDNAPQNYARDDSISADPFLWYYLGTQSNGGYAAAVGQRVSGGTFRTPVIVKTTGSGSTTRTPVISRGGSVPTSGGSISRGGFGIKSGGVSTGGSGKAGSGSSGGGAKGGSAGS